ncbi:MAG: phosphotransferase [Candidatus Saccharimonadales bacterium]
MYSSVVPAVLSKYGLNYKTIKNVQKGYRNESYPIILNDEKTINLIFYKREPNIIDRMTRADKISGYLSNKGFPVRARYSPKTLQLKSRQMVTYAALYNYLPGATIPWEGYTKKHIKLLGLAMSDMHAVLESMSVSWPEDHTIVAELLEILTRMETYFNDASVTRALEEKLHVSIQNDYLTKLRTLILLMKDSPDQRPLHMDMVRGNVLFSENAQGGYWKIDEISLAGVIDFEKASYGHPIFDIARTLAFLFVDCPVKSELKIRRYFLSSGYTKRGKSAFNYKAMFSGISHGQILDGLIGFFLLHDFYKFLRHTPYESLESNEHYMRTRNILIRDTMVRYSKAQ